MRNDGYWDGYWGRAKMNFINDPIYDSEYKRGQGDSISDYFKKEKEKELKFKLKEDLRKQKEQEMESIRFAIERDMKFKY